MAAATHLVVDGSNIATEGRTTPSLRQLDEAVRAYLADHPHDKVTVVVDATFGHRIDKSEHKMYEEAMLNGELVTPPAGAIGRGDAFILTIADRANATVLSNDSFQEFHGTYAWLFDAGRLVGGKPVPDVGWVFIPRAPVRGPASRRAVREAKKPPSSTAKAPARSSRSGAAARAGEKRRPPVKAAPPAESEARRAGSAPARGSRPEPLNEPMVFIDFVEAHPVGSIVEGEVERFSSHGAYVTVDGARCYLPLKALTVPGSPPPRSAREVLTRGEKRMFVVRAVDTPRRGIDLALSPDDVESDGGRSTAEAVAEAAAGSATHTGHAEEAPVAPKAKKTPAKKSPAKTAGARKAAEKAPAKAAAKKATATKTPAKKATATKSATRTKKSAATKTAAPSKTAGARKTAATKTAAKKATAAKSATATKTAAKKATAAGTAKTTATKSAAGTKKTAATKSAAASKSATGARKTAATKTAAKKATAAGTAKTTATKSAAGTKKTAATKAAAASKSATGARKTAATKTAAKKTTATKSAAGTKKTAATKAATGARKTTGAKKAPTKRTAKKA